ncbi:tetratricopeptide repeat protein [Clostridium sp. HMP27]|uniref:tetratricopeptide repeat protein n=1 Tax=Clostridium sp. HMP27 TaxID=1487921 RepID=UPI00052DA25F|nr:tetratricopeptide repeat protein [Clostridium sp. HMP27]KGK86592.1 hypothetical protein DP68_13380 [Clostridium sp. HMP27]
MFQDKTLSELNEIAKELASNNQWDDTAINVNKRIISKKSNSNAAYTRIAKCLLLKGDREGAYDIYKKVLEFDPNNTISSNFVNAEDFSARQEQAKLEKEQKAASKKVTKRQKK